MRRAVAVALLTASLFAAACERESTPDDAAQDDPVEVTTEPGVAECDDLDETACLLPFPNDAFTAKADTPTGRRLVLPVAGMPTNGQGTPIAVLEMNRADGFSPGSALLVYVPALDIKASKLAPSTDIGRSLDDDAPVVLVDAASGERVPYWAEVDARATSDASRLLIIRPAVALTEGARYAVGLRNLRTATNDAIAPVGWAAVEDGSLEPPSRLEHLRAVQATLDRVVGHDEHWWIAWDFTVASTESLSARLRQVRDAAYDELGDAAPAFAVTNHTDAAGTRTVTGTFDVPLFLTNANPGARLILNDKGVPQRGEGAFKARFICVLPTAPASPALPIVYGHGLLGGAQEVRSLAAAIGPAGVAACATDWIGMASGDLATIAANVLPDLSNFPTVPDRLQQAHVNFSFLGRLLNAPGGFASHEAFQDASGAALFEVGATQFIGNSQGGVLGGAASAVSTEWERAVLGVPGMNYSLLLTRSIDWDRFAVVFEKAYTDEIERVLALSLVQLLWDRAENQGYAQHLTTEPYEGIDAKRVLLVAAFGDHQVANVATALLARTIGARVHKPVVAPGRSNDVDPAWGLDTLAGKRDTSALVVWDYGTPAPPAENAPPRAPSHGKDPHGAGSREPRVHQLVFGFLRTGVVEDLCDAGPCVGTPLK